MSRKLSLSYKHLDFNEIANIYNLRKESLKLFFNTLNPDYYLFFSGFSTQEVQDQLKFNLREVENDACLNVLAAIEALFRIDYAIRCDKKMKAVISRSFRQLFTEYQYRLPFEDILLEEWKKIQGINKSTLSNVKGAFKFRHWLVHGRYWTLKAGKNEYDFYELFMLSQEVNRLPLIKI